MLGECLDLSVYLSVKVFVRSEDKLYCHRQFGPLSKFPRAVHVREGKPLLFPNKKSC